MSTPVRRWFASYGALALLLGCAGHAERGAPTGSAGNTSASGGAGSGASAGSGGLVNSGDACSPEGATSRSNPCNTCTCSNGAWVCGHSACQTPACSPGQREGNGCGACICDSDGQWQCTSTGCVTPCRPGESCALDEYCAYQPGQGCGMDDAGVGSSCMKRPTGCTDEFAPVCGCDGQTYATACEANRQGQGVRAQGACPLYPDGGI